VRTKRGQVNEVDERSGFHHFTGAGVQRSLHVAGKHGRGDQRNGQRHYYVSGLSEEQYPAKMAAKVRLQNDVHQISAAGA